MKLRWFVPVLVAFTACSGVEAARPNCSVPHTSHTAARWSVTLDTAPGAVAGDEGGSVVTLDGDAVLALDTAGRTTWRTAVPGAGLDWPVIDRDLVVVPVSGPDGAGCVALDRVRGTIRWRVAVGAGDVAAAAVAGDSVACASAAGRLVVTDRDTGGARWSVDLAAFFGGPVGISPRGAIALDREAGRVGVVIRAAGRWTLACWELKTGVDAGCTYDLGTGAPPSAAVGDGSGTWIVGDGESRQVVLIDLKANRVRLGVPTSDAFDPASIPVVAGGLAIVVDRGGGVVGIDLASGTARWRAALGQPVLDARPVTAGGVVAVVDWPGRIHTFRITDGRRADRVDETGGAIGVGAGPGSSELVAIRRGLGGNRIEGGAGPETTRTRPLQCLAEPGHSIRNDARP